MRNIVADQLLAKRPEARAVYASVAPEPRLEVRAAANGQPAEILFYDEVGAWGISAKAFARALAEVGSGPVTLRINSPGGDVFDGMAIHNAIKARGGVSAVVDGLAASAASYIMLAADTVSAHENAMVMVHRAWGLTVGNGPDHIDAAGLLEKVDKQLADMYAAKTGQEADAMLAVMDAETWFTAAEAKAAGLLDAVLSAPPKATAPETPRASADEIDRRKRLLRIAETV